MDLVERFINYTKFDTQSSEDSESVPSTAKQLEFAKYLKQELEDEGLSDVEMDDMGYIYATLKGNTKKKTPTIGFISHMDTLAIVLFQSSLLPETHVACWILRAIASASSSRWLLLTISIIPS